METEELVYHLSHEANHPTPTLRIPDKVNTRMTPKPLKAQSTRDWGMSPFNATLAKNVLVIADQLMEAQLVIFLFDPSRALDATPVDLRNVPCAHSRTSQQGSLCARTYLIPGGVGFSAPDVKVNDTTLSALFEVHLAEDQRSFMLGFQESTARIEFGEDQCQNYGFPFAAFSLCLRNVNQSSLQVRKVPI